MRRPSTAVAGALLVLLAACAPPSTAASMQCLQCYDTELEYVWQITGLPVKPTMPAGKERLSCSSIDATQLESYLTTCSSACVTLVTTDPNSAAQSDVTVRGCWDELTDSDPNWTSVIQSMVGKCDKGTITMYNKDNTEVTVNQYYAVCKTEQCNKDTAANVKTQCNNPVYEDTVKCYECSADDDDECESGSCSGRYCGYQLTATNGREHISKRCSPINPFGANSCRTFRTTEYDPGRSAAGGGAVPTYETYDTCFCRDKYYCNGAATATGGLLALALPALLAKLFA